MTEYKIHKFPKSRIATIDVCEIGKQKHHITSLIELNITNSRKKIRAYNNHSSNKISFNAWIISVIGHTIHQYETVASYPSERDKQLIFKDINISVIVEKNLNGANL